MAVAEVVFAKVAVKVLLAAMLVNPAHPAFEDGEEALDGVSGHVAPRVLLLGAVDPLMGLKLLTGNAVVVGLIGVQAAREHDVFEQRLGDGRGVQLVDMDRPRAAAPFKERGHLAWFRCRAS